MKKSLILIFILIALSFFGFANSNYFTGTKSKITGNQIIGSGEGTETNPDGSSGNTDGPEKNGENQFHKSCLNYQCVLIEGQGADECFSFQDCLPENYHTECINNLCALVEGEGNNSCSSDHNCDIPSRHTACKNMACVSINGSGVDECLLNMDCSPEENASHTQCINEQCFEVRGKGKNECSTNEECMQSLTCKDSDINENFAEGINPFLKGETSNQTTTIEDWCVFEEPDALKEYYCESNDIKELNIKCDSLGKYECLNGACIKKLGFFEMLLRKIFG